MTRVLGPTLVIVLLVGCGERTPTDPASGPPAFAKATAAPNVTAADPPYGEQGAANLDVFVSGSGFDAGSHAEWDSGGAPYPRITVNRTEFISTSKLKANITIAPNAAIQYYDIAVITSKGRKGIGTELFAVTYASPIPGALAATAVSDIGRVVGTRSSGIFVYDIALNAFQTVSAAGEPWTIDQLGTTVGGKNGNGDPAIWTLAGTWSEQVLPSLGLGGAARGLASDGSGAAVILGGNVNRPSTGRRSGIGRTPAKWTRNGSGGWTLTLLDLPPGIASGFIQSINAAGMAAGFDGTGCCFAFFWDAAGVPTLLAPSSGDTPAAAFGINNTGTVIVGTQAGPVAWVRASTLDPWTLPIRLPDASCGGAAYAVNDAGIIVGDSCGEPVAWKPVGAGAYIRVALGDLGRHCSGICSAKGINNALLPVAVGVLGQNSPKSADRGATYWSGF